MDYQKICLNEIIRLLKRGVISDTLCKLAAKQIESLMEENKALKEERENFWNLAEKLNVCDLVNENARLHNKIRFLELGG